MFNILCTKSPVETYTHTHLFNGPLSRTTLWAGTRKVRAIWILLEQETVSGSGISWAICMSAPRSKQITMPVPHHSVFYRPDALPAAQPTASQHWRHHHQAYPNIPKPHKCKTQNHPQIIDRIHYDNTSVQVLTGSQWQKRTKNQYQTAIIDTACIVCRAGSM